MKTRKLIIPVTVVIALLVIFAAVLSSFAGIPEHGATKHVTRELFIPANEGRLVAGTPYFYGRYASICGAADSDEPVVYFIIKVPDDFVSFDSIKAVWASDAASGSMNWGLLAGYAAAEEAYNTHVDSSGMGATATGGTGIINVQTPATALTMASLAKGDYIGLKFERDGSGTLDTLNTTVHLLGLLFTYTAEQ